MSVNGRTYECLEDNPQSRVPTPKLLQIPNAMVFKYQLEVTAGGPGEFVIKIPYPHRILSVGEQNRVLTVWAVVNAPAPPSPKAILVRGTGHPFTGDEGRFLGTVFADPYVWHLFEKKA